MSTTRETIPIFIIEELRTVRSIARITGLKYSCGKISSPLTAGWKNRDLGSSFRPHVSGEPQLFKSALQIGNFWIPKELGIFWNCWNLYRVDVPHVKHGRWTKCYRFSCSQPPTADGACSVDNSHRGVLDTRTNPDTCGEANSISIRYVWTWNFFNTQKK